MSTNQASHNVMSMGKVNVNMIFVPMETGLGNDPDIDLLMNDFEAQKGKTECIKKSLKRKVEQQRQEKGLEDIPKEDLFVEPKEEVLSVEAFEKREKRKEANRHAAKKSRDKRDQEFKSLKEDKSTLSAVNVQLKKDVAKLQKKRDKMNIIVQLHKASCPWNRSVIAQEMGGVREEIDPQATPLPTIGTSPHYAGPTHGDSASELNLFMVEKNIQLNTCDFDILNAAYNENASSYISSININEISLCDEDITSSKVVNTESFTEKKSNTVVGLFGNPVSIDSSSSSPVASNNDRMLSPVGSVAPYYDVDQESFALTKHGETAITVDKEAGNLLSLVNFAMNDNLEPEVFELLDKFEEVSFNLTNLINTGNETAGHTNLLHEQQPECLPNQVSGLDTPHLKSVDWWEYLGDDEPPLKRQKCC